MSVFWIDRLSHRIWTIPYLDMTITSLVFVSVPTMSWRLREIKKISLVGSDPD